MAELFTEEDVRRYAERFDLCSEEGYDTIRSILSALAEDGRFAPHDLRKQFGVMGNDQAGMLVRPMRSREAAEELIAEEAERTPVLPLVLAQRMITPWRPAESGGVLPSDTPAVSVLEEETRNDG